MFKEIYLPSLISEDWDFLPSDCSGEIPTSIKLEKPENIPRITLEIPMFDAKAAKLNYKTGLSEDDRAELDLIFNNLIEKIKEVSVYATLIKQHLPRKYENKHIHYLKNLLTDRGFKVSQVYDDCDSDPWISVCWDY
jgi:hypothetical protein